MLLHLYVLPKANRKDKVLQSFTILSQDYWTIRPTNHRRQLQSKFKVGGNKMTRRGFTFRALMAIILIGLLALGGYAIFQAGVSQGYSAAIIEGLDGVEGIAPRGGFGFAPYRYGYGFGFSPFFGFLGLIFRFLIFFLVIGFIFRLLFFRRTWGWHGRRWRHKDWAAHWEKYQGGPPPWMDRRDPAPEDDETSYEA